MKEEIQENTEKLNSFIDENKKLSRDCRHEI